MTKVSSGVGVGEGGDGDGDGGEGDGAGADIVTTSTKVFSPQSAFLLIVTKPYYPQLIPQEFLTIQSPLVVAY